MYMSSISVFISHSSLDRDLAKLLIDAIMASLVVPTNVIRCTSVEGYTLDPGVVSAKAIQQELVDAAIVIGILTPNSIASAWPLCELGAAWGMGKNPIILLGNGITFSELQGPLASSNALRFDDSKDLNNLLDYLKNTLRWKSRSIAQRGAAIDKLISFTKSTNSELYPSHRFITRAQLLDPDQKLRWTDIAKRCQEELYIWGWCCSNVINLKTLGVFQTMACNGVGIHFLLLDPNVVGPDQIMNIEPICNIDRNLIRFDHESTVQRFNQFYSSFDAIAQSRISLRYTDWFMTWDGVAIDPRKENGLIQIEFYLYNNPHSAEDHLDTRPELILRPTSPFYEGFRNSIESMWKNARSISLPIKEA